MRHFMISLSLLTLLTALPGFADSRKPSNNRSDYELEDQYVVECDTATPVSGIPGAYELGLYLANNPEQTYHPDLVGNGKPITRLFFRADKKTALILQQLCKSAKGKSSRMFHLIIANGR